jgi:hypothetical protein
MELSLRGVAKVNFELEVNESDFKQACSSVGLDSANFKTFTPEEWNTLRTSLIQVVNDFASSNDFTELHDGNSVLLDEVHIDDAKNMTVLQYDMDGKFHFCEIN